MVVSDGLTSGGGSELVKRSGCGGNSFGPSGLKSSFFTSGLVEPGFYVSLPMLSEMHVGKDVVVLNHGKYQTII